MEDTAPQTLPPEVENAINAIASNINAGETIVFCGAGISRDSGLPVVSELVPYVLLTLCACSEEIPAIEDSLKTFPDAQERQDRLKQIIAKKMEVSFQAIDRITNSLPFEAFMETLRDNSRIDRLFEVYDAEAYKPHIEPNTNHTMLARLVATGKVRTIVTTNFDQLIEKALEHQGKQAGLDYDVIYRDEDFERIDWAQDRIRLIKIHGSIDDKQAIAITLSQVARQELSVAKADIIRRVFGHGDHRAVLILGYSCSDVFDLSPQIEALTESPKQVCLVQHSSSPRIENIREQEQKNPFKAFVNSTRLFINTSDLVEALWEATLKGPYEGHEALETTPDWKAKLQAWYVDSEQMRSDDVRDVFLGQIFAAICEWRTAIARYEHVIANAGGHADEQISGVALGNLGNAYESLGEYDKSIGFHEQALEIHRRIGNSKGISKTLVNMGNAYYSLGEYDKSIGFHEQALEIARLMGNVRGESYALGNMGNAYYSLGEYGKAIGFHEQALEIARRIGDVRSEGRNLDFLGNAYSSLGEYRKAIGFYEQALEIARRIGDVQGEGNALDNMGVAYRDLSEYGKAIGFHEQALEIARRIGDAQAEGRDMGNIAAAYYGLGEYRKAIGLYEQALETARRIGDVQGEGCHLGHIGVAYYSLGEHHKAIWFHEQALEIDRRIGNVRGEGYALGNMGNAYYSLGEYRKAIGFQEQALEIARRIGDVKAEGNMLGNMGNAYRELGEDDKAIGLHERALEIARLIGDVQGEGSALGNMGNAYIDLGEYGKAIGFHEQHLEIARRIGDVQGEGNAVGNMGIAYALMGDKERAARAFVQSKAIFARLGLPRMLSKIDEIIKQVEL
jgi:tetratricopeptide (TPR) repeat protein